MEYSLTITGSNPAELASLLGNLNAAGAQPAATVLPLAAVVPTKKTKAKDAPTGPVADVPPVTTTEQTGTGIEEQPSNPTSETDTATEKITIEAVRAAVMAKSVPATRDKIRELLTEFGVSNVPQLKEADYPAFLTKVNAL